MRCAQGACRRSRSVWLPPARGRNGEPPIDATFVEPDGAKWSETLVSYGSRVAHRNKWRITEMTSKRTRLRNQGSATTGCTLRPHSRSALIARTGTTMADHPATTQATLAARLSRLLLPSLFVLRDERDQIDFRHVPPTPSAVHPRDVLRSFRPEIPATAPVLVTRRHPGCIMQPLSLHESH